MVGLPGTGLGGLFYGLLILWIILREGWFTLRGGSRASRWKAIAGFGGLLILILVALSLQAVVIAWVLDSHAFLAIVEGNTTSVELLTPGLTLGSLLVLAGIFAAIHALRLRLAWRRRNDLTTPIEAEPELAATARG